MNRLIRTAPKSVTSSLRLNRATPSSSAASTLVATRHFSDASTPPGNDDGAEIKFGHIKVYDGRKQFGFIVPDGVSKKDHSSEDLAFIHANGIKQLVAPEGDYFNPFLKRGLRVQFKVAPPEEGKASMRAYDLTLEDGALVPPFLDNYLDTLTQNQKALFGTKVFNIYTHAQDQAELETQVVAAFDEARDNIEQKREMVARIEELYEREGKKQAPEES